TPHPPIPPLGARSSGSDVNVFVGHSNAVDVPLRKVTTASGTHSGRSISPMGTTPHAPNRSSDAVPKNGGAAWKRDSWRVTPAVLRVVSDCLRRNDEHHSATGSSSSTADGWVAAESAQAYV